MIIFLNSEDFIYVVARCNSRHRLPWGATGVKYKCIGGSWIPEEKNLANQVDNAFCYPVCERPCMNGGWCHSPNICRCPEGFFGEQCERSK